VTKPGFNFLSPFYVVVYFVMDAFYVVVYFVMDACLLMCVRFSFCTKPRDWLGRLSSRWPICVGWDV